MPETPGLHFESGDTVNTYEELFEGIKGQPSGFNLLINIWWGEQNMLWEKVERSTGLKIAIGIKKMYQHDGKPALLVEFKVL